MFSVLSGRALGGLLALGLLAPLSAAAEETAPSTTLMETVTVTDRAEDPLSGRNTLDRDTLGQLPGRNGSINEMLTVLPGIQTGEFSRTSDNAGEILPPSLSISGGRFYENNFVIDGLGSNSLLDPAADDKTNVDSVAGHPQEFFINPLFVKRVDVYRFNVPARYGSFTGGVVDVETRDPERSFGGELTLRHTRDEWTELHYDGSRQTEFATPRSGTVQPKFDKYDGAASLDLPLTDTSGLLLGYGQVRSRIPLMLIDSTRKQERTLENYLLKYVVAPAPATKWRITAVATPYEDESFLVDTLHSDFTVENRAYGLASKLSHRFDWGAVDLDLGYRSSQNNRSAPADYFIWNSRLAPGGPVTSKPWGAAIDSNFSKEGGFGDLETEQATVSAALHLTGKPLAAGPTVHLPTAGVSFESVEGSSERTEELTRYTSARLNANVVCEPGAVDCIPGEQFMIFKNIYPANRADAVIRYYNAYVEDTLEWGRLTLRPGLRLSYDDLQHNDNWAPRLAASYDLFGDGRTRLVGGLNRYYGKTLLTHALNEEKTPLATWTRSTTLETGTNLPQPWALRPPTTITATRLAGLDTPYSDEWVVGLEQELLGGLLQLNYLERNAEDELATTVRTDGIYRYTEWTNDGSSQHREATLSWERSWRAHYLLLTATWQETETSFGNYLQRVDLPDANKDGLTDPVWYDGHIVERDSLPRPDFNREWGAALTYVGRLPGAFTFTNVTRYRSAYEALENTGADHVDPVSGERLDIFETVKQSDSWIFDWRLDWERKLRQQQTLALTLEVNNVFDKQVKSGASIDVYDLGRQFWLGMTYKF